MVQWWNKHLQCCSPKFKLIFSEESLGSPLPMLNFECLAHVPLLYIRMESETSQQKAMSKWNFHKIPTYILLKTCGHHFQHLLTVFVHRFLVNFFYAAFIIAVATLLACPKEAAHPLSLADQDQATVEQFSTLYPGRGHGECGGYIHILSTLRAYFHQQSFFSFTPIKN